MWYTPSAYTTGFCTQSKLLCLQNYFVHRAKAVLPLAPISSTFDTFLNVIFHLFIRCGQYAPLNVDCAKAQLFLRVFASDLIFMPKKSKNSKKNSRQSNTNYIFINNARTAKRPSQHFLPGRPEAGFLSKLQIRHHHSTPRHGQKQ
jgi:hypothetical protein